MAISGYFSNITAKTLIDDLTQLNIKKIHHEGFLESCVISSSRVQRPGLALAGHFGHIRQGMTELFGATELEYLESLGKERSYGALSQFAERNSSLYIVSKGLSTPLELVKVAEEHKIPILELVGKTMQIQNEIAYYLDYALADQVILHGVCMEVYGLGIIITGKSGIGKSECALELIKRGHRLIADDAINVRRRQHYLIASCDKVLRGKIELRGVGVLDICTMFGEAAVRYRKKVDLIIDFTDFSEWNEVSAADRLGLERKTWEISGISVPMLACPVSSGRNMSEVVELAAKNQMLRIMGQDSAKDFLRAVADKAEFNKYNAEERW